MPVTNQGVITPVRPAEVLGVYWQSAKFSREAGITHTGIPPDALAILLTDKIIPRSQIIALPIFNFAFIPYMCQVALTRVQTQADAVSGTDVRGIRSYAITGASVISFTIFADIRRRAGATVRTRAGAVSAAHSGIAVGNWIFILILAGYAIGDLTHRPGPSGDAVAPVFCHAISVTGALRSAGVVSINTKACPWNFAPWAVIAFITLAFILGHTFTIFGADGWVISRYTVACEATVICFPVAVVVQPVAVVVIPGG